MALEFTSTGSAASTNGVKVLAYSPSGVGKTVLCATAPKPIMISAERGELSLRKANIPMMRVKTHDDVTQALAWLCTAPQAKQFETVCIDSLSEIAESLLAELKPKNKDPRKAYGELGDLMHVLIRDFRDLPFNVYMTAKQERIKDEATGMISYGPSMPGNKLSQGLPYYFDEVFRLAVAKTPEGVQYRYLQTQPDSQYEAKDRSGVLDPIEPPNLTQLFSKILGA